MFKSCCTSKSTMAVLTAILAVTLHASAQEREQFEVTGLIKTFQIDSEKRAGSLTLSVKGDLGNPRNVSLFVDRSTLVKDSRNSDRQLSDLQPGLMLHVVVESRDNRTLRAKSITILQACTSVRSCPMSKCRHKCGAKVCTCPLG